MKLKDAIQKYFAVMDREQHSLSKHWRTNTNRRTIFIALLLGAIALALYLFIIKPPDTFPVDSLVSVPEGSSAQAAADALEQQGVVRNAFALKLIVKIMGQDKGVHAGDYIFKQPEDIFSVAYALVKGQFGLEPERIRIPEGATVAEISDVFSARLERFNSAHFLAEAEPLQGYLFPDTYFFLPNATEDTVLKAMRQNFDAHLAATTTGTTTLSDLITASGHSLADIVTMASIVEREAPGDADRRLIAGVLWNRIKRGMPLQSDATLTVTLGKNDTDLTLDDLATSSPYNTYTHKGLPPGPIDNPSLDAMAAAADPTPSTYLYYLADHRGVTHYAKTYAGQLKNESLYLGH